MPIFTEQNELLIIKMKSSSWLAKEVSAKQIPRPQLTNYSITNNSYAKWGRQMNDSSAVIN